MNKIFHIQSSFKAVQGEESIEEVVIEGLASTDHVDRVGDVIELSAWKGGLTNFKTNPVILFNHNADKPIGKALSVRVTERGLELRAKISKIAGDVATLIQEGILGAFSVGFKIKDAEWDDEINGLRIKSAELLEVSVVSVPANQAATFSVAKSFDSDDEYREYIKTLGSVNLAGQSLADDNSASVTPDGLDEAKSQEIEMDPKDIQDLIGTAVKESLAAMEMKRAQEKAAEETAAKLAAEKAAEEEAQKNAISVSVTTAAEKLLEDVAKRFEEKEQNWQQIVTELKDELTERSEEIKHIREQKALFADRGGRGDWEEKYKEDIVNAAVLGAVTRKGWDTKFGQEIVTKVNAHSGVQVPSADFEQLVSTSIERDVELELVLARLFREIPMRSATQILPIMPDADYAQWSSGTVGDTSDAGGAPYGNLGDRVTASPGGIQMTEKILSVNRLVSKSYLGNETEEDAIMPVLPLIRESMVRAHARAIEHSLLNGQVGSSGGSPNNTGSGTDSVATPWKGLLRLAQDDSKTVDFGEAASPATRNAANLLQLRQAMAKYGRRPEDVVFIVSLEYYYGLLEDPAWADVNLVGQNNAVKITGEVGRVYNSPVIVCDEFQQDEVYDAEAVALNARNFIIPRLRGFTMESDYIVEDQRRVLVATQRLGFDRIHSTAGQVVSGYFAS